MEKTNIIFILLDQLRSDSVGTFGHSMVRTPNMDKLAGEGAAFENCFVQHTVCTPSRCSIMTGWYAHVRGHRTLNHLLHKDEPNLMKYLKDAGYWVEWHGKNDLMDYESFVESVDHKGKLTMTGKTFIDNPWEKDHPLRKSFYFGERIESEVVDHDYCCIENAINFIQQRPEEKPFFLYLPLLYPHPPYNIEEPYFSMYDRNEVPAPAAVNYDVRPRFYRKYHTVHGMDRVDEKMQREIIATYYGMITRTDMLIGKLLDTMEKQGLKDNTAIVICSDHGDYTCDYGLVEKWWCGLTDNLVKVPLIISYPGMSKKGQKFEHLVESIDLFPTILDLAGIKEYHTQYGKSLLPLVEGQTTEHRECVFAEGGHHPQDLHCREDILGDEVIGGIYYPKTSYPYEDFSYMHRAAMARTAKWKYIKHLTDVAELFDLEADPREENNLALDPVYKGVIQEMESKLLNWYMQTSDVVPMKPDKREF